MEVHTSATCPGTGDQATLPGQETPLGARGTNIGNRLLTFADDEGGPAAVRGSRDELECGPGRGNGRETLIARQLQQQGSSTVGVEGVEIEAGARRRRPAR